MKLVFIFSFLSAKLPRKTQYLFPPIICKAHKKNSACIYFLFLICKVYKGSAVYIHFLFVIGKVYKENAAYIYFLLLICRASQENGACISERDLLRPASLFADQT